MDTLRNVSGQSFLLMKQGGSSVHLFPGRAVILSTEEMKSPQVRRLLDGGFARVEQPGKPKDASKQAVKEEKRSEKKKVEN
jgi:hypothetical protein